MIGKKKSGRDKQAPQELERVAAVCWGEINSQIGDANGSHSPAQGQPTTQAQ